MSRPPNASSVASQASNALLLSSNTYLLGGTPAGAGVTSPMGTNAGVAESKEEPRIARAVSAPEAGHMPPSGPGDAPLLLSQPNFPHSMQHSSGAQNSSGMGSISQQSQISRSYSGSPVFRPDSNPSDSNMNSAMMQSQRQTVASLTRSIDSFRVLAECPLIVMLLFQLYPKFQKFIPAIVPLMMNALALSPMTVTSAFRTKHKELIAAQVCIFLLIFQSHCQSG